MNTSTVKIDLDKLTGTSEEVAQTLLWLLEEAAARRAATAPHSEGTLAVTVTWE